MRLLFADWYSLIVGNLRKISSKEDPMLTRQRTKILLGSVMLLLISVAVTITHNVTNTHASPQNQDRILKQRSWPNEPVKIKLVTSKKGAIKLGETFSDDDDWFRGLTLKIENKSDKAITYIALSLMFKRPDGETGRPLAYSIRYNQRSARFIGKESEVTVSTQYPPIQPGEFADVKTFEQDFNSIKSLLLQAGYVGGIKAIDIVLEEVIFGDGSGWPGIKRNSRTD